MWQTMWKTMILGLALTLTVGLTACAAPGATRAAGAVSSDQMFERMKGLEGQWVGQFGEGEQAGQTTVDYRVSSNGSALIETVFAGQPHEMVTVYTVNNGQLVLTHYCAMGNQPYMEADPITSADEVSFEATALGNAPSLDATHMHWAVLRFLGDDHIQSEWTVRADGKREFVGKMDLHRGDL